MTIVASNDPRILTVEVTDDLIIAHLADGRTISVPWRGRGGCPMLPRTTAALRDYWHRARVHWPDVDEDISAIGMLTDACSPPKQRCRISRCKGDETS